MTVWHGVAILFTLANQAQVGTPTPPLTAANYCQPVFPPHSTVWNPAPDLATTNVLTQFDCRAAGATPAAQFLNVINAALLNQGLPTLPTMLTKESVVLLTSTPNHTSRYWLFKFGIPNDNTNTYTVLVDDKAQVDAAANTLDETTMVGLGGDRDHGRRSKKH